MMSYRPRLICEGFATASVIRQVVCIPSPWTDVEDIVWDENSASQNLPPRDLFVCDTWGSA